MINKHKKYLENKSGRLTDSEQTYLWACDFVETLLEDKYTNKRYFFIDNDNFITDNSVIFHIDLNKKVLERNHRVSYHYGSFDYNLDGLCLYFSHRFNTDLSFDKSRMCSWRSEVILKRHKVNNRNKLIDEIIKE